MGFLTESERATVLAAAERLVPAADGHPGAGALGVVDYIDGLLDAFAVDPPRIFAGGPSSGRFGGAAAYEPFLPLTRLQQIAWRERISAWQRVYRDGLAALGAEFRAAGPERQDE